MSAIGTLGKVAVAAAVVGAAFFAGRYTGAYDVLDDLASGDVKPEDKFKEYDIKDRRDQKSPEQVFNTYYNGMGNKVDPNKGSEFFAGHMGAKDFIDSLVFGFSTYTLEDGGKGFFSRFTEGTAIQVERSADGQFEFLVIGDDADKYINLLTGTTIEKLDLAVSRQFQELAEAS